MQGDHLQDSPEPLSFVVRWNHLRGPAVRPSLWFESTLVWFLASLYMETWQWSHGHWMGSNLVHGVKLSLHC
ncbi:hypothetical protein BS78_05G071500 [Paspalum vaginatum]|nr:hypothetical protein BS78_05G071500 [Paspalum vaginatum]